MLQVVSSRYGSYLDLGCGTGRNSLFVASKGFHVVGVDLSFGMLKVMAEEAKRKGLSSLVDAVLGDVLDLPLRSESFEGAMCVAVLHHIPGKANRIRALGELRRVVRRGKVLITVWKRYQLGFALAIVKSAILRALGRVKEFGDVYVPWRRRGRKVYRYYHLYTRNELERELEEAGFSSYEIFEVKKAKRRGWNYFALASTS